MQFAFAVANVALSLVILLYASWSDYKTREVSNRVWAIYAPIALTISLIALLLYDSSQLLFFGISFGFTTVFALILFYTGGFGGADSKALICIALALPFFPFTAPLLTDVVSPISQILFPITILSNSVLFAAMSGIYMLLRNFAWRIRTKKASFEGTLADESVGKKFLVFLTGHKFHVADLKAKWHIYPMEDIEETTAQQERGKNALKRKLIILPKDEGRDKIVERLSNAAEAGRIDANVWASPGLAMLIFVTAGLVAALLFGDIIWILISLVL